MILRWREIVSNCLWLHFLTVFPPLPASIVDWSSGSNTGRFNAQQLLNARRFLTVSLLSMIMAKEGDNVLDLCCGSGDLAFLLSEKVGPNGQVTALDFSKEQLQIAASRQRMRFKPCYKNIKWVEGNAVDLPFSDSYFDGITIGYGLRNVVDRPKAIEEMCRVLKKGSKVSVLDFNKSTHPIAISFQDWVIDNVIVPVASGYGLGSEYEYLKNSIKKYLTGDELEKIALEAGFSTAKHYEFSGGLMGNLVASR
ncbi:2-phytyl-1,4-beta-naphthoquinone methyltransferase, chloroplastic isoform X2 [Olea europaea var. sylvestris]|uniref:2-phytyl-1,4-beta-naphthoquinone methyltransferase, chloroplastic isoform X2 n=1 Tax=Olea europaea var. sylvestris TaxID=158386 RepID=UPI000C1D2143|nr:2-phytyl-1,4-beta-naphthoquinone methyltransferase, chloroplastic isoform X2 [Olea europaea var. sylvestris]